MSTEAETTATYYFQAAAGTLAIYNSIEVISLTFITFQKYSTLYFYSLLGCAFGDILFAIGFIDLFFELYIPNSTIYRPLVVLTIGWYGMVTGFGLVLYSRLHLINVPKKYIQYVKYFMIYNVIFSHFPTTVMTFGANVIGTYQWTYGYRVMEGIQMTFFCIQEANMGFMYLHWTRKLTLNKKTTTLVRQTMYINMFVIFLDVLMLGLEYANDYNYQIMLKCVVYSIKLKLEFYILNILTKSLHKNTNETGVVISGNASGGGVVTPSVAPPSSVTS